MAAKTKPAGLTDKQWSDYKIEMEYRKLTKGFDPDDRRKNLDKQDYLKHSHEMQTKDWKKAYRNKEYSAGDSIDMHINCGCYFDSDNYWVITSDNPCDDCLSGSNDWNAERDADESDED